MLYFGDYGIHHAKMIPIKHLWSIKPSLIQLYPIEFHYFKAIIYSYSKIIVRLFLVFPYQEGNCFQIFFRLYYI